MHVESVLHVRDHSKVQGPAHHMLEFIASHTNRHTGDAYELTADRIGYRLDVTPQWVRRLRARLVAAGELELRQSRGRHPNVYRIPYERCPACQETNPQLQLRVQGNPKLPVEATSRQPETGVRPTRNSGRGSGHDRCGSRA